MSTFHLYHQTANVSILFANTDNLIGHGAIGAKNGRFYLGAPGSPYCTYTRMYTGAHTFWVIKSEICLTITDQVIFHGAHSISTKWPLLTIT